jgi:hypothetical protein
MEAFRCTYCGRRGDGLVLADLRGVRYDYCDAACATAHRMAVELTAVLCQGCDADAVGDTDVCAAHLDVGEPARPHRVRHTWRRAG